jgi:C1A family cysteine protease
MFRTLQKIALSGSLVLLLIGAFATEEKRVGDARPTGLIPLDAGQIDEIATTWPRVTGVNLNWMGFERINAVRAGKGKAPLDSLSIKPVGREVESSIAGRGAQARSSAAGPDLAGDLPTLVDNSKLKYFPPIRNQNQLGSCASFATTYTQFSYMAAFQRDLDIRDNNDNTNKYSPKWTYNMANGGTNEGSELGQNYRILQNHGACTWAEFPYDNNYLAWCLSTPAWQNALRVRADPVQYVWDVSTDAGLAHAKELITNGYVLIFGTYITSWLCQTVRDDPATADDDPEVGKSIGYWLNGTEGSHAMTIVGYNDAIWTDINGDGLVHPAEKGAFRVANSWGAAWEDQGFIWLAYDALRPVSAVPSGPSQGRVQALQNDALFVLTVRDAYAPLMTAEFTVNHAKRSQLKLALGTSDTSATVPSTSWTPAALQNQGGAYAFDGSSTAVDATFVLDFTDILVEGGGPLRYYLGMGDNAPNDPATLRAFRIFDLTTDPPTEVPSSLVPQSADGGQVYAYVDYAYPGPAYNHPPRLSYPQVDPSGGLAGDTFAYFVYYHDQDGDLPSVAGMVVDGSPRTMAFGWGNSASDGWYRYESTLAAGSHSYSFYFEDGEGGSAKAPLAGAITGPEVYSFILSSLSPVSVAVNDPSFILTVDGADFVEGAVVRWDGSDRPTTFIDASHLAAEIGVGDLTLGKIVRVTVRHPGGGLSNDLAFAVENPAPNLTSLSPDRASAGGAGFTLTLHGSGFVPNSTVLWNGIGRTTNYVSGTELQSSVPAADIAAGGEYAVTVANPAPAGGISREALFYVSSFTLGVLPTSTVVSAGRSVNYNVAVAPVSGSFDARVSFNCTGLPRGCRAAFSPPSVTPGANTATIVLTIATTARNDSAVAAIVGTIGLVPPVLRVLFLLFPAVCPWFALRKPGFRTAAVRRRVAGALISLVCLMALLSACGAGGDAGPSNTGTPVGTYGVGIHAVAGGMTVSTAITLIVR